MYYSFINFVNLKQMNFIFVTLSLCILTSVKSQNEQLYKLSIAHLNDFHARFEEISETLGPCKPNHKCVGGLARIYSVLKSMKSENPQYLFLNAGDNYQGTLWFNIFRWNGTQHFLNFLPFDAMTFGNHEFDDSIEGIVPFLKHIKFPVVASNIDDKLVPEIQNLYKKSIIVERNGKKIGIIGVVLQLFDALSHTGKLKFLNEADSINEEAERLSKEGTFTNIVLSHCGYDVDKAIARNLTDKISVIIGGHSHSLLYTGTPPSNEDPVGPYPTLVLSKHNTKILIVQASAFTQYLGNITVSYDLNGLVNSWEGKPIYLDHSIPEDEMILKELQPWKDQLEKYTQVFGETKTTLDISKCFSMECNIGNFVADAMVEAWKNKPQNGSYASFALVNSGSIKANIEIGNITYQDLLTTLPWNNTFDVINLKGSDIKKALDFATRTHYYNTDSKNRYLMQVSGVKVVYNTTKPLGSRVVSIEVLCQDCPKPIYETLDEDKYYRVITSSYLLLGRDSFYVIKDKLQNFETGPVDVTALSEYVKKYSPLNVKTEKRITLLK